MAKGHWYRMPVIEDPDEISLFVLTRLHGSTGSHLEWHQVS